MLDLYQILIEKAIKKRKHVGPRFYVKRILAGMARSETICGLYCTGFPVADMCKDGIIVHMKSKLFSIVAGFALAGSAYAQAVPLLLPPPPPVGIGMVTETNPVQDGSARIVFRNDLQFGMEGSEVFELQYVLQARNYLHPEQTLTGYFGSITRSAVMAFQRAHGISATGFVGPLTRAALNGDVPEPTQNSITINLGIGSSGGQVLVLQNKLLTLGYFSGEVTGYFGVITRAAVVAFQQAKGISMTGYVGPLTRAALNAEVIYPEIKGEEITMREGQQEGPFLLQKVYADYVTGINFAEYPVPTVKGYPVTLRVGETVSNGCTVMLTLVRIENANQSVPTAIFLRKIDSTRPCPICLPGRAMIDTPSGQVSVKNIIEGMRVWTSDANGNRVSAPIVKTSRVAVPETHTMVSLKLEDGRVLLVSLGHPTADARIAGDITTGDMLDGSKVMNVERVSYSEGFTYDILPAGATGTYWADGILIGSTLR